MGTNDFVVTILNGFLGHGEVAMQQNTGVLYLVKKQTEGFWFRIISLTGFAQFSNIVQTPLPNVVSQGLPMSRLSSRKTILSTKKRYIQHNFQ